MADVDAVTVDKVNTARAIQERGVLSACLDRSDKVRKRGRVCGWAQERVGHVG